MDQEVYEIVMKVLGEEKVKGLSQQLQAQEQALKSLLTSMQASGATQAQMVAATSAQATAIRNLSRELADAQKEMSRFNMNQQGLLKLGYLLDDLQYVGEMGLRPIINNLMVLEPRLGIAALLFETLYRNADRLRDVLGMGGTKTEAQEMEELGKKTEKTAEETLKLLKYERERANIKTQIETQPKHVSEMAQEVNRVIGEFGQPKMVQTLLAVDKARYENLPENAQDKARVDALDRSIAKLTNNGMWEPDSQAQIKMEERDALRKRMEKRSADAAAIDLSDIASDPGRLQGFINHMIQNIGALGPGGMGVMQKLMAATPEFKDAQEQNDKITKRAQDRKAVRDEDRRQKDEEADYDWSKLMESNASWKAYKAKQDQIANRQRAQEQDQQQWANSPLMGAGGGVRDLMLNTLRLGGNAAAIGGQVFGNMMAQRGVNAGDARRMVDDAMFQARMARSQELLDRALPSDIRSSQVIGAASLASQIQSSITNKDDPRRLLNETIKQSYLLNMILQETRNRQGLRFR